MIEKKPRLATEIVAEAQAEADFDTEVAVIISKDPASTGRPLKYSTGLNVLVKSVGVGKVEKGNVGVYLIELGDSKFVVCPEEDLSPIR